MRKYTVVFSKRAEKDIQKLPTNAIEKIIPAIVSLENNPRPHGCKKLRGYSDLWRIRIGDYRVIYSIDDVIVLVDVREVGNRKDIYQ